MITLAAFLLRLALLLIRGFAMAPALARSDVAVFASWMTTLAQHGTQAFYLSTAGVDYVPGYLLVLYGLGKLYAPLSAHDPQGRILQSFVRLPAILADTALVAAAAYYARRFAVAPVAAALLAVSPAVLLLSAYWGQVDAIGATLLVLAVAAALDDRTAWCWLLFAAALVIKPQPLVAGPLLLVWQLYRRRYWALAWAPAATAALCYATSLPFTTLRAPFAVWGWFLGRYESGISKYPYASVNAFNVYGLAGRIYTPDGERLLGISLQHWGLGVFALVLSALVLRLAQIARAGLDPLQAARPLLLACACALMSLFMLTTRMHERYAFIALALVTLLVQSVRDRRRFGLAVAFHLTFFSNCVFTLAGLHDRFMSKGALAATAAFAAVNLVIYLALMQEFFSPRLPVEAAGANPVAVEPA